MKIAYFGTLDKVVDRRQSSAGHCRKKKSFTLSYDPDDPKLYSSAKITIGGQTVYTDKALWDTGTTISAISHSTARQFDAPPSESGTSISATSRSDSDIYLATIELPGGIIFHDVEMWDVDLSDHGAEVVIGMDIISRGRLTVETIHGVPTFSFDTEI